MLIRRHTDYILLKVKQNQEVTVGKTGKHRLLRADYIATTFRRHTDDNLIITKQNQEVTVGKTGKHRLLRADYIATTFRLHSSAPIE